MGDHYSVIAFLKSRIYRCLAPLDDEFEHWTGKL
jgi:hypothetical protein